MIGIDALSVPPAPSLPAKREPAAKSLGRVAAAVRAAQVGHLAGTVAGAVALGAVALVGAKSSRLAATAVLAVLGGLAGGVAGRVVGGAVGFARPGVVKP